jgi:hypothetical protein
MGKLKERRVGQPPVCDVTAGKPSFLVCALHFSVYHRPANRRIERDDLLEDIR